MAARQLATSGGDMDIINHYVDGFRAAMMMTTACELGILDKVEQVAGGISASDLAQSESWNQDATCRFMDTLASLKFLSKSKNTSGKDVFTVTGPGRYLLKEAPGTVEPIAPFFTSMSYSTLSTVAKIVKHGAPKPGEGSCEGHGHDQGEGHGHDQGDQCKGDHGHDHSHKHGSECKGDHGHGHGEECKGDHGHGQGHGQGHECSEEHGEEEWGPEMMLAHYQSVGACLKPYLNDVIGAFDLSKFKTVVDLGAGSGEFTFALRAAYPSMHITMNELPEVTELLEKYILPKEGQTNISVLTGSFLEVDLPKADLFIICKTLHHFDRDKHAPLVQKVYNSTNPGGAFLIAEKILYNNRAGPATGNLWDVFCLTDGEGIMSTEAEYTNLLKEAGFGNIELARTNDDCPYDVMIGRKQ